MLLTHGVLGESLIQTAMHVLNRRPERTRPMGVAARDDPLHMLAQARRVLKELDEGDGVLILTDMYGATPANIAAKLVDPGRIEAVAGVNVPMLIRAITYRGQSLETMLLKAVSGGCEGVLRIPASTLHHGATGT